MLFSLADFLSMKSAFYSCRYYIKFKEFSDVPIHETLTFHTLHMFSYKYHYIFIEKIHPWNFHEIIFIGANVWIFNVWWIFHNFSWTKNLLVSMFALRFQKWNHYNFHYEHLRRNLLYCGSPLNATHNEQKSTSIGANKKDIWKFPIEKPFNYNSLKLTCWHKARQVSCPNASSIIIIILCTKIIMNIKHGFPSRCCCFFELLAIPSL